MNEHLDEDVLHALASGELAEDARALAEAHAGGCAECRGELDALRKLSADLGGLPRSLEPPRDLWPAIAARIEAGRAPAPVPLRAPRRRSVLRPLALAAAIAAVVLSITWLSGDREAPAPAAEKPRIALAAFRPSEAEYRAATAELLRALEARRGDLRPETIAVIEENLRVIDAAIENVRTALQKDPASSDLTFLLASAYEMKLDLLRQATRLPRS